MQAERFLELLTSPRTLVMGVLNVTPDSFSDGGKYLDADAAIRRAFTMLDEGADILDIGGQSTRPPGKTYGSGADDVIVDKELLRVLPVIEGIVKGNQKAIISIDTTKAEVARRAIDIGTTIVNDVSGGTQDKSMFDAASSMNAPIILMHGYGPKFQKNNIEEYHYNDVVGQVGAWLERRITLARQTGIKTVLADIGFGFAKTAEDNIALLKHHAEFTCLGVPMVLGVSRKSTIGKMLGGVPPEERIIGSIAAAVWGATNGAKILRVHDVKETVQAMKVVSALR
ncbi:MAG TPA: dihydropteroate synthase [Candidatus Kapabacteria bacterium]|nr:dihydropteroate synthase [Candidatus Kapabacteria bacterium]